MYKVICFDLDGTLLDTINDIASSMNMVLQHHNLMVKSKDEYISYIGDGSKELVQRATGKTDIDEMHEQYNNLYNINACKKTVEYDDVSKTLLYLKTKYKLAIVTNKPHNVAVKIVSHYFKDIFDFVLGHKEGTPAKPNTNMMDEVLSHYKLKTTNKVFYIGDSEVDHKFCLNTNTDHYIVTHGYGKKDFIENLDNKYKINNFKELLTKL